MMHHTFLAAYHVAPGAAAGTPSATPHAYAHGAIAAPGDGESDQQETKHKVREYMERRRVERRQNVRAPLHEPDAIRKEIGWDSVERRRGDRRGSGGSDGST